MCRLAPACFNTANKAFLIQTGGKEARYANVMQVVPSLIDLTFSKSAESLAKFLIHLLV